MPDDDALERRFPRRLLLGGGAAAAALAAVEAIRPAPAAAAPGTTAWQLGGNGGSTPTAPIYASGSGGTKGVWGHGGQYGVYGDAGYTAGVRGDSGYVGLWGEAPTYGANIIATATSGAAYGVYCKTNSAAGYALYAAGNVAVAGTLSKSAGSFRIDHLLDPDRRWLSHSFVESPDMMNVYNGNVVLDADGTATVTLPEYFGALNREFRYQLTCLGGHAPVYVAAEVQDNRFTIGGGTKGLKVSWQVTGIRQDDYAREHPIVVDAPKSKAEIGSRVFVPAGSSARRMDLGPTAPPPDGKVPAVSAAVPSPPR